MADLHFFSNSPTRVVNSLILASILYGVGLVTLVFNFDEDSPNFKARWLSPEFAGDWEIQMIKEENAVPSKHDFIILVMVDSFQDTVFGISCPPVIVFF